MAKKKTEIVEISVFFILEMNQIVDLVAFLASHATAAHAGHLAFGKDVVTALLGVDFA